MRKIVVIKTSDLGVEFDSNIEPRSYGVLMSVSTSCLHPHPHRHRRGVIWETDKQTNRRIDLL